MALVVDKIRSGAPIVGEALCLKPDNQSIKIDYTTLMGGCSNLYYSLIFQMPKWGFSMAKVDEYMSVTPAHADAYNLTISQKQKLEGSIKTGLASIAQAVSDYELIAHDYRRYKEIYQYFVKGEKDEHVLRSLFVDRVDAYTGENYSMVTMARRWPTIITDFIRMQTDLEDVNQIRQQLDVSAAEATVLKTKNQLYKQWKKLFKPVVEERLSRFKTMMDARKKSIDDYKTWLKPYVSRHKMMKDSLEAKSSPLGSERTSRFMTYGFGQAVASTGVRLWTWKPFVPEERRRAESFSEKKSGKFVLNPYDDYVKRYIPEINLKYGVNITDEIVIDIMNSAASGDYGAQFQHIMKMDPNELYYLFFDITLDRSVIRTAQPEGGEVEDMMFSPLQTWVFSQNMLLLHLIELRAIELSFEREIDEIIGIKDNESEILDKLREEVEGKKQEKKSLKSVVGSVGNTKRKITKAISPLSKYFIHPGPYEYDTKERLTKIYMVGSGTRYGEFVNWIKDKMGVK